MNVIIGLSIFLCTSFVGIRISSVVRNKLFFAQDFLRLLDRMANNVNFEQKSIEQVLSEHATGARSEFRRFLGNYPQSMTEADELSSLAASFLKNVGKRDKATELEFIEQTKFALMPMLKKQEENQKKGYLATKLGALVGLALCIIVL